MILLSLASKQIWPQVLAVAHLKPQSAILLHTEDMAESKGPAQRLQRLFESAKLVPPGGTRLEPIPHNDFSGIESRFDEIVAAHHLNLGECVVNFTGGNKLMATAVFRRVARRGVRAFYLERGNLVTWFEPRDGDLLTHVDPLPVGITNHLDAASLLACQFGEEVVQFQGELLTLNPKGQKVAHQDLAAKLQGETRLDRGAFDFRHWLQIENPSPRSMNEGDNLEYATAFALLKSGVPRVRRGVELATLPNSRNSEGELDLVFNWNGRLWVVDCKDRAGGESKVDSLRTVLLGGGVSSRQYEALLKSIAEDLKDRDIKILREDLLQIAEVGGLLGCALAVRSAKPPQQALEFAASRHPHVEVLLKADLVKCLPAILAGRRPR
ncbi:MAG: PDDEXK family nuclease [Limisphaerales bacterium]